MDTISPDQEVDQPYLTDLLRKALERPGLQITEWKVAPIHGGMEWDSAVFRFQGSAREAGETFPWSLILKTVKLTEKTGDPGGIWYWKREALAYQSGLLHRLPGGNVTAPACYEVQERPDGSLWLWLEEVKDDIGAPWPVEHYAVVARHLGQFNGAYLVGQAFPCEPWVTRNWLRQYVEHAASMIEFVRSDPGHPTVMALFPGDFLAQILATWEERERILEVVENLPQVFCHQDAFKRNLFARQNKTVAIDWGYMGIAPVGSELVALVEGSIHLFEVPVDRVQEMDRICFEGYLQGLRDAGWDGDPRLVRTGYTVTCLLRYPIGGGCEALPTLLDQEGRSHMEVTFDRPVEKIEKTDPALAAYYQALIPEALKLLGMKKLVSLISRIAVHTLRLRIKGRR
jgi:hypothetical protein